MANKPTFSALILASGSTARRELLGRLGLAFHTDPADIDESRRPGESPAALVERLAREKARVVAMRHPDGLVIGSDQVAVFEGEPLGKPGSIGRAEAQLRRFGGREVTFLTGVCVHRSRDGWERHALDSTRVRFRPLDDGEIERYVARDRPVDCAGAFKVEALGPALFSAVHSEDPTGLQGLPLIRLCALLREAGLMLP